MAAVPANARDFEYTYEGQTLTYTVIDEDAKTCATKRATTDLSGAVILPEHPQDGNVEYTLSAIGYETFDFCQNIISIKIPNSVTIIEESAFESCTSLTSIVIPNSVTIIGEGAFRCCESLTSIDIPNSVESIGDYTFVVCSSLTSINIPNSVKRIGDRAFYLSGLTSIVIPNSVTEIGDWAFSECDGLTSVYLSNSVTTIGMAAFFNNANLKDITLPTSLTNIGSGAFYNCNSQASITYLAEEPADCPVEIFNEETYQYGTLNFLESAADKISKTTPWNLFVNRIGRDADFNSITEVRDSDGEAQMVYNLSGIKVANNLEGLPAGVYIVRKGSKVTKVII